MGFAPGLPRAGGQPRGDEGVESVGRSSVEAKARPRPPCDDQGARMTQASDTPPEPPTEEEVRQVAELFGCSESAARRLIGEAELSGKVQPDGTIIDA
jgi:hypothetical protein